MIMELLRNITIWVLISLGGVSIIFVSFLCAFLMIEYAYYAFDKGSVVDKIISVFMMLLVIFGLASIDNGNDKKGNT